MGGIGWLAVVSALAAPEVETSRVELLGFAHASFAQSLTAPQPLWAFGDAGTEVDVFLHPLADDEAPYSLQPFLQRASIAWLDSRATWSQLDLLGATYRSSGWNLSGGFDVYVHRWVAVHAEAGGGGSASSAPGHPSGQTFDGYGSFGLGVRWEDARIDLSYHLYDYRLEGTWAPLFTGDVKLSGEVVLRRRLDLTLSIETLRDGAVVYGGLEGFVGKRLGIYFNVGGGGSTSGSQSARFNVGVAPWTSRHLGFNLGYTVSWSANATGSGLVHLLSLVLRSRSP